jgi:hypothetical protein
MMLLLMSCALSAVSALRAALTSSQPLQLGLQLLQLQQQIVCII